MLVFVKNKLKGNNNYHYLAFIGFWLSIILDTVIYSNSSITNFVIVGVLFFYYGIIYDEEKYKNNTILREKMLN